ncbi:MAG: biotin/lipoyl-containing protein [Bacteroidota bacterium]
MGTSSENNHQHPFQVQVSDQWTFDVDPSDELDIVEVEQGRFHLLHRGLSYQIDLLESNKSEKSFLLSVNGNPYQVHVSDAYDQLIAKMGFENQASQKAKHIMAPMPGLVLEVKVESGQEVREGEALLILEAMKMENVLKAPADGIIKLVSAAQGASVDKGQLLIEMA